jgi:hypothetical protein
MGADGAAPELVGLAPLDAGSEASVMPPDKPESDLRPSV